MHNLQFAACCMSIQVYSLKTSISKLITIQTTKQAKTKNKPVLDIWRSRRRCAAAARRARDTQSGTPEWSPPSAPVPTPTGNADTGTCWNNIQLSPLKVWKTWLTSFLKWEKPTQRLSDKKLDEYYYHTQSLFLSMFANNTAKS